MKKHLLLNQFFGMEGSPNQTDETLTRENRIGLMSYLRRTLMLLFAVLVMSIANIGMAWGASPYNLDITTAFSSTGNQSKNDGTVTINAYIQSKKYNNTSSTKVAYLDGSNYLKVSASSACITSITVTANTDDGSNTKQVAYQTSADNSSWSASTNMGTCANRESTPTERTVNFSPAVRYVRFTKGENNSISVGAISITYSSGVTHTVTAATEDEDKGTAAAGSATVVEGATTTITATPKSGYKFDHWTYSGTGASLSSTTTNPTTLTMGTANATVTAYFVEKVCPSSGTVYSLSGWSGVSNTSSWSGKDQIDVEIAGLTISGGSAHAVSIESSKKCGTTGSGASMEYTLGYNSVALRCVLDCPLAVGDVITIESNGSHSNAYILTNTNSRSSSVTSTTTAGTTKSYTVTSSDILKGKSDIYIWRSSSSVNIKTINISRSAATCTDKYSFHYGPATGDWETPICFEKVGSTHEWNITNFAIPDHTNGQFWVGHHGETNSQSQTKAWTDSYSDGNGAMKLLPVGSSIVGQATGAIGTINIWDDSGWKNQNVGFTPNGYGITYGGSGHAFHTTATAHMLETDVVTLPDVSTTYIMGLATATSGTYVTCAHSKAAEAISNMGVTNVAGGKKAIYLVPGSFNVLGTEKYAIYDKTADAFSSDFMKDDDGDGIYVGYVSSGCTSIILVRMSADATTSELASKNWTHKWNQTTGSGIAISGDLAKKYTITKLDGDNCSYSTANMQPITGQKGKFRMWDNSADQNWYVHFIPYYVLSYNANGGSGTTAQTERNSESSILTVSVAANGFTAPTGYTFAGWATSEARADEGTVDYAAGADYSLTSDATLYAVWTPKTINITLNKGDHGAENKSATVKYDATALTSITHVTPNTGYTLTGYYDGETKVLNANGSFAGTNVSGYITSSKWTKATDCTLTAKWECVSLTVNLGGDPATPAGGSPIGTEYTLTCSASTGVIASYQWKQNTTASTAGAVNAEGTGATTASFSPVPAAAGTYYYYCVATDACGNSVNTSFSGAFQFNEPVDPCSEPTKVTNEIARFFVPCGLSNATSGSPSAWTVNQDASTGDNTFTTSGFGGGSSNWYRNETSGLIYGKLSGDNSYIQLKLKSGNFQAGDVVTAYFNRNDANKSGLTLKTQGSSYAITPASTAAGVETSGSYTLVADAIEADGSIKLFRANSSSYVNRIIVTRPPVSATITATKTSPDYVSTDPNNLVLSISTTGASSGWYYRVKKVDGGYQNPDNTPYNTATWTMTSGMVLGVNNFVVELYNGSDEKQAESATITVTAETAYPMTIAAGAGGSVSPSGEIKANESGNHIHPEITATPASGYHFDKWTLSNANATLANANAATTTITNASGACTITANFEADDACPTAASGEVVYKFVTKSSGLGTSAICANKDQDYPLSTGDGNPLETLTNGTLTARASSAGTTNLKYNTSSINFNGGSSGWLIIGLDCPIKSGDVIRYVNNNSGSVAIRTAKGTGENEIVLAGNSKTDIQTVVISAAQATAFNELTTVYMVRKSNTSDISYFEIIRPYVITLDANTNGGKVNGENTEVHYMLSGESLVLPHATKSGGYRFKGWFTTSDGATQASTNYSPTGTTTLYAQFEDCPGSGTVYKWEVKSGLENGSLPVGVSGEAEMDANEGNYLSTLIGGTLTLHNKNNHIKISDESKFSIDDNAPYIIVNLDCALEAGDKFVATVGSHTAYVTKTSSRASTVELPTGTKQETAVPAALEGASTLYIWRGSGNYKISYFEITRTSTTYTVSYDANGGSGTAPTDGTAYARNAEVTVKGNTGSLTKSNYAALAYWNTANDGTGTDYAISTGTFEITADVTLYAKWTQAVTFDANTANHGSAGGSATAVWNATGLTGITHATPASGYKLLGYYTTDSGDGVKVLNSDGTFASSNVTDYITSGKWSRTDEAPTLYARYESSGALIWNLGVNTEATSLTTSSKNSDFTQIAVANMGDATLSGSTYTKSAKSSLTGKISSPATKSDYVYVTFKVADGYKFTPSNISVKVQPVGENEHKNVELLLTDESSHSLASASATKCDGTSSGKTTTVSLAGNSTFFTGNVTLKIYVYDYSGLASGTYRLGTPITIEGAVEATCVMPSFTGLDYDQTSYTVGETASAITVTNPANETSYAWKQNTTNDRSGTTPASGTNNTASYTPPTSAAGTLYYWCELTNACGTVKTPAVGITVSVSKSDATISWTGTSASANYGGGGYTVKATVNETGWNGNAADLTLSAPAGIRIYNIESGTIESGIDDGKKYVQASFDVTTAFDRETYSSTIPFVVTADATTTYNAISDEEDVTFDACTGGGGSSEEYMPVDAAHIDNTTWKGGWVYDGIGMMRYSHGGSAVDDGTVKSLAHNMGAGSVITKYYKSSANHFGFYTEKAINGVRLYVYTSNAKSTVSGVYIGNSAYASGTPSTGAVTYEATYYNDDDGLLGTTNDGCTWVEITFDSEVAAGKYGQINLSANVNIAGIAFISSSGSGAKLDTHLQWSGSLAGGATVDKKTTDAYFTYSASMITENTNSLGAITYSSSDPSVATVDATGKVAMVAAGTTTIKATLAASGCYKKAEISYTLNVTEEACAIAAGTLALTSGSESKCSSVNVTLTLTGFESGATLQWKDGDTDINNGGNYTIVEDGTTSTLTTNQPGTYSVIVTKGCFVRSNRITITNKSTSVHVTRLVKEWYIKNGRLTPDIALWELGDDCSFVSVAASSGWDAGTGLTEAELGEKVFYEKDGIVYLKGTEPKANAEAVQNYTLTLTVNDGCGNQTLTEEGKKITIHHQQNTDKHVLAFVVNGTAKGGFTDGITAAQTTSVGLYNAIAAQFDVQATNIYSTDDEQKLREYYSQYDILCITDYPNTQTKGVNSKSYVDAIGSLIDIRPILTMEAFVSKLANWKAKGISGNPKSPTTRQYTMDLQCKDHEIFAGTYLTKVGEGDEAMYRVSMVDNTKEDYATLDATYGAILPHKEKESKSGAGDGEYNYGGKPALQGFTFTEEMSDNDLLPIGLIDDGAGNPLQVGIERQHNMEARLMVLGINSYAMERLTDDGERVVINALNYLMKKNAEDIADCSTSFVGGYEGDEKNWNIADNWTGNTVPLPSQKVRILADCEVRSTVYALDVLIVTDGKYNHGSDNAEGKLTIKENGALIVGGKIQAASAPAYNRPRATTPDKLLIETSSTNQAALIFDNEEAETQATVNLYSLGRKPSSYQYQYFAVPMEVVPVNPTFANETHGGTGIYTYVYNEASSGWERRKYYDDLFAFEGLGITTKSTGAMEYTMTGNLASTATKEITLTKNGRGLNLIGNSWMAPIQIGALAEDNTDTNITKTVYIYCAGRDAVEGAATEGVTETAGQWIAIPFEAAEFETWKATGKLSVIPAMQAFEIKVSAEATLTLDYKKVVRGSTNDLNAKLRAPGRRMAANEVTMTNIRVADSKTHTDLSLFEGDRFSEAFDNGWEAEYMKGDGRSAKLYAETEAGQMAVAAMYDYEGTVVGFAPGKETEYTFSFMGEDNGYYLNDIKLQNSVRISEGETYTFTYEEGDAANRFYISRTAINAPAVATGMENLDAAAPRAQKIIYNDKLYIIRGGRLYDATGKVVK